MFVVIISNNINQNRILNKTKPLTKNSFISYQKGISCDHFVYTKKEAISPIKFTGIGYFLNSSKGRKDLSEYVKSLTSSKQGISVPKEVKLPDLKDGQKIDRIVLHWSGTSKITPGCLTRYHYIIGNKKDPKIYKGTYSITDNARKIDNNKYAAHIHQGNSHSIGISLVGMKGSSADNFNSKTPITEAQFEKACKLIALISIKYNLKVTPDSTTTHHEYGVRKGDKNKDKIDIQHLPWKPELKPDEIGNYIRERVNSYIKAERSS